MTASGRQSHWQNVYLSKGEQQVSWTQADPQPSLGLIEKFASGHDASIIDVGGGASRLVDALLAHGFARITIFDLSEAALQSAQAAFAAGSTLADYTAVQQIAGDQWSAIKPALLQQLQQSWHISHKIDIYLYENMLTEAMTAVNEKQTFVPETDEI